MCFLHVEEKLNFKKSIALISFFSGAFFAFSQSELDLFIEDDFVSFSSPEEVSDEVSVLSEVSQSESDKISDEILSKMVFAEGGTFKMGCADQEKNESPVHDVTVSSFWISSTEVTQKEYEAVLGENFSFNKKSDGLTSENPVEEVSWYDAVVYCNRLSVLSGFEPVYSLNGSKDTSTWGSIPRIDSSDEEKALWNSIEADFAADGYRLPTEAEWEYAAKEGSNLSEYVYSGSDDCSSVAWYSENSGSSTQKVGSKKANALGLYDMNGNVWEWCFDWYDNYHYAEKLNPAIKTDVSLTGKRIRRGGSVLSEEVFVRNENRASSVPELRGVDLGFRVVRSAKSESAEGSGSEVSAAGEISEIPEEIIEETLSAGFDK